MARRSRPNIFEYRDYRDYLRDYYETRKRQNGKFSFRLFAAQSGVSSSLFNDIISGRRALTEPTMRKYANAMGLTPKETAYFGMLVRFVNGKDGESKFENFAAMVQARRGLPAHVLDRAQYEFYSQWHHSAVRELVTLPDFRADPEWIASRLMPRITTAQARASLDLLERLNLLRQGTDGKWIQVEGVITSEPEFRSLTVRAFNSEMIRLARESIDRFPMREREISGLTLGVSPDFFQNLKKRIREFKLEILDQVAADASASTVVCQLNFQLFPLVSEPIP